MNALVMGGTGFIGKRLVDNLLKSGIDVTIATSGRSKNPFGEKVRSIVINRFDPVDLEKKVSSLPDFDLVFDQICFGPDQAESACRAFAGKVSHYVLTSTASVYSEVKKAEWVESDFDDSKAAPGKGGMKELGYAEGKRSAESFFHRNAPFPFAAVRFPIVVGHDDVTGRFQFHVDRVREGRKIVIPEDCGKMNYVWVEDAGRFLAWIGVNGKTGPYNAASSYVLDAEEIVERIGRLTGKEPEVSRVGDEADTTSYCFGAEHNVNSSKAEAEGFKFTPFEEWFPLEVKKLI